MNELGDNLLQRLDPEHRDLLRVCGAAAADCGAPAYLVGGSVRDLILGRAHDDIDIVVEGDGLAVAQAVSRALQGSLKRHHAFQTATVATPGGLRLDVATARSEDYPKQGQLPQVAAGTLDEDLRRRDFTINAMAIGLGEEWGTFIDPLDGRDDLEAGRIRVLHSRSFADDPTRVLRALRFAVRFGYALEAETLAWLRDAVSGGYLQEVSGDRVRKELSLTFGEAPVDGPLRLQEEGVLRDLHAGLRADEGTLSRLLEGLVWYRALPAEKRGGEAVPSLWVLVLACCASALPQQGRWELVRRLRLSREERGALVDAGTPWLRARAILDDAGADAPASRVVGALGGLSAAALLVAMVTDEATAATTRRYLRELRWVTPALGGTELQDMGVPAGPKMGEFLARLRAARLDGDAVDDADERRLVQSWLAAEPL